MKQLGIIGLGAMGAPMAGKLQECGFQLFTTVRSAYSRQKAERMGIQVLETAGEIAERTDRILLMVSNYEQCAVAAGTEWGVGCNEKGNNHCFQLPLRRNKCACSVKCVQRELHF